jgi:predicted nuclease of restriction endonuclease-like (RecB) superfamily
MDMLMNTDSYFETLESIKAQIKNAQYRAVLGVNREQILLYWSIGKVIIDNSSYGKSFVKNLARDIKSEFPGATGYSVRNLLYMRKFAEFVPDQVKSADTVCTFDLVAQ